MAKSGNPRNVLPAAPSGERHVLPLRARPNRARMSVEDALRALGEPSSVFADAGIVPAAVEAGARIRLARIQKGLTQSRLAKEAGISQPALSDIENGKGSEGPSYATLRQLAQVLDLDLMAPGKPEPEEVELSVKPGAKAVDVEARDEEVSRLANASFVLGNLIDTKLFDAMRSWMRTSFTLPSKPDQPDVSRLLTVNAHQSAQVFVDPMTTLVIHGNGQFISTNQGVSVDPFSYGGSSHQVAMVAQGGLVEMRNHGAEAVLVFAVSPQTLLGS